MKDAIEWREALFGVGARLVWYIPMNNILETGGGSFAPHSAGT
jgi:hypothetical protein